MRAWQVATHGEPREALRLVDIDPPQPGPGDLLVRVAAAAVGLPDALMCRDAYAFKPPLPFVPGQEVCGEVVATGDAVSRFAVGDRVMGVTSFPDGRGGFAELTVIPESSAYRVPAGMDAVEAAGFRIGASTGWMALVRRGGITAGEWLVVLGASGGSGSAAVQLGAALGARVIAVASGPEKLELCRRLGAEVVIDRRTEQLPDAVLAATGPGGAQLVYDPVGGELASAALLSLGFGGRFLAIGFASGSWVQADPQLLAWRNVSLVGVLANGRSQQENDDDHEALLALAAGGALRGVTTTVPFDQLPEAVGLVGDGTVLGKMIVTLD